MEDERAGVGLGYLFLHHLVMAVEGIFLVMA
jgi:hypothetical protein